MKRLQKTIVFTTVILLLSYLVSINFAAEVETFNVDAGNENIFTLSLHAGMNVEGTISVTGGNGNDIDFWITDPSGNIVLDAERVSQETHFDFAANENGKYNLHFNNSFSILSTKNVVITYEITISGLNGTQLLLLAILVAAIIVVGIVIILKKGKKENTCKKIKR
ncbi:MAG: emp24/gp25L/p24 family protein [Candidatus Bathyarchaeota archaeon]